MAAQVFPYSNNAKLDGQVARMRKLRSFDKISVGDRLLGQVLFSFTNLSELI